LKTFRIGSISKRNPDPVKKSLNPTTVSRTLATGCLGVGARQVFGTGTVTVVTPV
jgi:hypothetical protein